MDHGQWVTLDGWLAQLPEETFAAYPDLSCDRADMAAAKGDAATAHRWYGLAASQYVKRNDAEGACRSMLADSAVAAEAGDLANALSRANAAGSLADAASLTTIQMWATWQQGRVALAAGDCDSALASFSRAASSAALVQDGPEAAPIMITGDLAARVEELRRQEESHREMQAALKRAQHETLNQLLATAKTPVLPSKEVFGSYGWSGAPVPLKLPGLTESGTPGPDPRARPLNWLRTALMPHRTSPTPGRHRMSRTSGRGHPRTGVIMVQVFPSSHLAPCLPCEMPAPGWRRPPPRGRQARLTHGPRSARAARFIRRLNSRYICSGPLCRRRWRGGPGLAKRALPLAVRVPADAPGALAATRGADGGFLARILTGGLKEQPERRHPRTAADASNHHRHRR